jgi:hypothetical protein
MRLIFVYRVQNTEAGIRYDRLERYMPITGGNK